MAAKTKDLHVKNRIIDSEVIPGALLIACAAISIALANSPLADAWHALLHHRLEWAPMPPLDSIHAWINDGAMALFFFVVGLEIKREIIAGTLADPQRRRLPVLVALAGMAIPAATFLALCAPNAAQQRGWAIPAATDIAFAMGVLALVGKRVPPALRLFLLTVAIVDDLGAVLVIALFYAGRIDPAWLAGAAALFVAMALLARAGVRRPWPFLALGVALWVAVLHSGVHATVAGVLAALTVPLAPDARGQSALLRLEHALTPFVGLVVVPLFGLANAGVSLGGGGISALLAPLPLAIAGGLFLGKQTGVLGAILLCERTGLAPRPHGATLMHLWGVALLCGIGFTMSLFVTALAFPTAPELVEQAKLGILAGSLLSALAGAAVLRLAPRID